MILSTKNLNVVNKVKRLNIDLFTKDKASTFLFSNKELNCNAITGSLSVYPKTNKLKINTFVNKLDVIINENFKLIPALEVSNLFSFKRKLKVGWNFFSCPLDSDKAVMTHDYMPNYSSGDKINYGLASNDFSNNTFIHFMQNNIYEFEDDETPLFYKNQSLYINRMQIIKDESLSYLPTFFYSGINRVTKETGYQIKVTGVLFFKIKAEKNYAVNTLSDYNIPYNSGWYNVPCNTLKIINLVDFFKPYTDLNQIDIVKSESGGSYLPTYNFNGIGSFTPGEYLQVKFINI